MVSCGGWAGLSDALVVLDAVLVVGGWGLRSEGEASRPLTVREGRARVRVCVMYC